MPDKLASVHKLVAAADPHKATQGETAKAFAAFCAYRDQDPFDRSGAKVVPKWCSRRAQIEWSSKFDWVERVAVWDAAAAKRRSDRLRRRRDRQDDKHLAILESQTAQIAIAVEKNRKLAKKSTVALLSPEDVVKAHATVVKTERLVMGEATEITATQEAPPRDFSKLTVDERVELARINEKLTKG